LQKAYAAILDVLDKLPNIKELLKVGTAMFSAPADSDVTLGDILIIDGSHKAMLLSVEDDYKRTQGCSKILSFLFYQPFICRYTKADVNPPVELRRWQERHSCRSWQKSFFR